MSWDQPKCPGRPWFLGWYQSTIAKCVIKDKKIKSVSFIPTYMGETPPTTLPKAGSREFCDVYEEMKTITAMEGIDTLFEIRGDEVLLPQTVAD